MQQLPERERALAHAPPPREDHLGIAPCTELGHFPLPSEDQEPGEPDAPLRFLKIPPSLSPSLCFLTAPDIPVLLPVYLYAVRSVFLDVVFSCTILLRHQFYLSTRILQRHFQSLLVIFGLPFSGCRLSQRNLPSSVLCDFVGSMDEAIISVHLLSDR